MQPAEALVVRPGETLVVRYDRPLSPRQAGEVCRELEARLPGVTIVVVEADQIAKLTAETMEDAVRLAKTHPGHVVRLGE